MISLLVRPGAKEFVDKHAHAKWWTFSNKDREVDGQVVREVSDDDGQVGVFQTHPHEISGRPVVDANKYALQLLDHTASKHLGIQNQDRPLIGVRGQKKDMVLNSRVLTQTSSSLAKLRHTTLFSCAFLICFCDCLWVPVPVLVLCVVLLPNFLSIYTHAYPLTLTHTHTRTHHTLVRTHNHTGTCSKIDSEETGDGRCAAG